MRVIWKFVLRNPDANVLDIPVGGRVVHADKQDGYISIWAEVDPNAPREARVFHIYPTGMPVVDGDVYIGTVRIPSPPCSRWSIWHIFERKN